MSLDAGGTPEGARQQEAVETVDKREDANPLEKRLPSSKRYAEPPFAPGQGYTRSDLLPAAAPGSQRAAVAAAAAGLPSQGHWLMHQGSPSCIYECV
ncbi:hypothetical protein K0M31_007969 [Melipona bicolor]|uniref:Uncharacterized protein n=1 Tax=Melipona bicolor TaxID=60889 RepID=A0AA40KW78_9HYME|nr:hypothetical protein K0M31_007969 [Melipona bicolor]